MHFLLCIFYYAFLHNIVSPDFIFPPFNLPFVLSPSVYTCVFYFIFWLHWAFSSCSKWELPFCCVAWASHRGGFSCCEALGMWTSLVAARRLKCVGSVFGAHWLCHFIMCGIFLDQGSKPCPLHWKADSYPPGRSFMCTFKSF